MSMTSEERALRSALTDAAAGQPPAPHDRIDGVRRRHARRKQRQFVSLGAAAVLAIAGAALAVVGVRTGGGGDTTPAAHRILPAWALQWPDHRDPAIPQSVLDGAVQSWLHDHSAGGVADDPTVAIWYLAQHVANDEIAVAFEYSGGGAPYFVMGHATANEVMNGQPGYDAANGSSAWVLYTVPTANLGPHPVLGLNIGVRNQDDSFDNDIVVLTDPRAHRFDFQVVGPDGRLSREVAPMTQGYAEINVGQIRSRVRITAVRDSHGDVLAGGMYVDVPTTDSASAHSNRPTLMRVPQFTNVPLTSAGFGPDTGQGTVFNGSEATTPWPRHATTVYARCYGGRNIVVEIDSDKPGHRVVIPCDDREHVVNGPPVLADAETTFDNTDANGNPVPMPPGSHQHTMQITASDYTAWRVAVVAR